MQSHIIRFALIALPAVLMAMPRALADGPALETTAASDPASRYGRMMSQYESLPPAQREAWLWWLLATRSEPACRATMDRETFERTVAGHRATLDRVRTGYKLSSDELLKTLEEVDRQEQAAIERLTGEYREVTHQSVGTNLWEYQRRMQLYEAIKRLCDASPYPFEGQAKLIGWLEAAMIQQRLSGRPPMPPMPDFDVVDDRVWLAAARSNTPEVKTSLELPASQLSAAELAPQIAAYNTSIDDLRTSLYGPRVLDVEELNAMVDHIARLGLTRIALASNVLALARQDRQRVRAIETLDDAIVLARVKVSAARRQVSREANGDTSSRQWRELEGLNRVAVRLDMLATGPDR